MRQPLSAIGWRQIAFLLLLDQRKNSKKTAAFVTFSTLWLNNRQVNQNQRFVLV